MDEQDAALERARRDLRSGLAWTASGAVITAGAYLLTDWGVGRTVAGGVIFVGVLLLVRGGWRYLARR